MGVEKGRRCLTGKARICYNPGEYVNIPVIFVIFANSPTFREVPALEPLDRTDSIKWAGPEGREAHQNGFRSN